MQSEQQLYLKMIQQMWLIRFFEEQARDFFMKNKMRGASHLYIGQEAIAVGVCSALNNDDYITSTHRGHGHCIAKGADPKRMMAELLGKASGYCQGKGGSMHIADLDFGNLGANGIVGGGIGLAAGAALAAKYRQDGRVAVAFFGDGAINQGVFFETANMASLWKLPLLFVCERNQFAEFSYTDHYFADPDLSKRAIPFNFPALEVDGNDVLAMYHTAQQAVQQARQGAGPTLIIANTYRIMGHTIGDPLDYRRKDEVEQWQTDEKDPILRFEKWLIQHNFFSAADLETSKSEAQELIQQAAQFALQSPEPALSALWENVYA